MARWTGRRRVRRNGGEGDDAGAPGEGIRDHVANALQMASSLRHGLLDPTPTTLAAIERRMRLALREIDGAEVMGTDVMAVVYKHAEDGALYAHGFGKEAWGISTKGDKLTLHGLNEVTDVKMFALPNGDILMRHSDGKPLWREFE